MKRSLLASAILLAYAGAMPVFAQDAAPAEEAGPLSTENFSSTIYLTTDYRFRGISNTDGPALQGSIDYTYDGFFAGVWGSNTKYSDAGFELDFYAGYRFSYTGLDFTVQGLAYTFPGEDKDSTDGYDPVGIDGDSVEINFGVSHTFEAQLSPTVGFNYYFSPNFYGEDGAGHAFQFNGGLTLPMDIGAYVMVGYQTVKGDKYSGTLGGYNYAYYQAGTNYTLKGFKLDVSWTGTDMDESLKDFYPNTSPDNFRTLIQGTFLLTVSRTF